MVFRSFPTKLNGIVLIETQTHNDGRGFFLESYKKSDFENLGIKHEFNQDNLSLSAKGVLRGLHYQIEPFEQGKLVRVITGRIFDVAVDIRKGSGTFGSWLGIELSSGNKKMLWIPPGFAHGFLALEDDTNVLYKTTKEYSREHERGIIWNDPRIGIRWPMKPTGISEKDADFPDLDHAETFTLNGGFPK